MSINIPRGKSDEIIEQMISVLRPYEVDHPQAQIDLYRMSPYSVRIRIIDPVFAGQTKSQRHERVWIYLDKLPEDPIGDISSLTLLTPDETEKSGANMEFEDPVSLDL